MYGFWTICVEWMHTIRGVRSGSTFGGAATEGFMGVQTTPRTYGAWLSRVRRSFTMD